MLWGEAEIARGARPLSTRTTCSFRHQGEHSRCLTLLQRMRIVASRHLRLQEGETSIGETLQQPLEAAGSRNVSWPLLPKEAVVVFDTSDQLMSSETKNVSGPACVP